MAKTQRFQHAGNVVLASKFQDIGIVQKRRRVDHSICPFSVAVDDREKAPWTFQNIPAGAKAPGQVMAIATYDRRLPTGDYSIVGMETRVVVERKSKEDAYGTFGGGRERFVRELERMRQFESAMVVIEDDIRGCYFRPPPRSRFSPSSFINSIISWQVDFPTIHWMMLPGRAFAELFAFRFLERFWIHEQRKLKAAAKSSNNVPPPA